MKNEIVISDYWDSRRKSPHRRQAGESAFGTMCNGDDHLFLKGQIISNCSMYWNPFFVILCFVGLSLRGVEWVGWPVVWMRCLAVCDTVSVCLNEVVNPGKLRRVSPKILSGNVVLIPVERYRERVLRIFIWISLSISDLVVNITDRLKCVRKSALSI